MVDSRKDHKFMEIAIEEMRKSRSEHINKFDPMVGAALVGVDGIELGRTHRAGLRVGDHAEYTLIERLLTNKNLEGSTPYVTLEPCTVRKPPNKPCAELIISARIGRVIIGIPDPNPEIQGHGITRLLDNDVEVNFFDSDLVKQVREENKDFIEQYDKATEISEELIEEYGGPSEKEKEPVLSATLEDFLPEVIHRYLVARSKSYEIPSPELWTFFHKNGFVAIHEGEGKYIPTIAGLLLFGKSPEDFLVQSKIKVEAHDGEKVVTTDIAGPLILLIEKVEEFFVKNMRTYTEIKEFKREKVPEYPLEALREAVVNAIVHRDYKEGARVIIQMFQENIVIKSPGLLLRPLSLDKVRAYNAPPYSRNPRIAETFNYLDLMEERGWGLGRMHDLLVKHGLRPPEFNYDSGYFVVTLLAHERAPGAVQIAPDLLAKLDNRQKELLDFICNRVRTNSAECAKNFKINKKTVNRNLNKLIELGIIEKKGKGPTTYYVLTGT